MPLSRGKFLKTLGSSVTGYALDTGIAAVEALAKKAASIAIPVGAPAPTPEDSVPEIRPVRSGPSGGNRIALTFDDGPTPGVTDLILDELGRRQLKATFFMIGQRVVAAPELARQVLAEGHEIGNHTFTHPKLGALPDPQAEAEIEKTQEIFRNLLGYTANWFRPPYGDLRKGQRDILQRKGLGLILWNVDPSDWAQPGEAKIIDAVLTRARSGSIVLCHDLYPQTARCLGKILDGLLGRQFNPTTVSSLLNDQAITPLKSVDGSLRDISKDTLDSGI